MGSDVDRFSARSIGGAVSVHREAVVTAKRASLTSRTDGHARSMHGMVRSACRAAKCAHGPECWLVLRELSAALLSATSQRRVPIGCLPMAVVFEKKDTRGQTRPVLARRSQCPPCGGLDWDESAWQPSLRSAQRVLLLHWGRRMLATAPSAEQLPMLRDSALLTANDGRRVAEVQR